jgi:hypothetical protein
MRRPMWIAMLAAFTRFGLGGLRPIGRAERSARLPAARHSATLRTTTQRLALHLRATPRIALQLDIMLADEELSSGHS